MSRNSYRGLTLALVLIVSLGMALPAAARPAEQGPATQDGLLVQLWDWVEHLWRGVPQPDKGVRPTSTWNASCDNNPDRGIIIDPNGNPCGH